MSNNFNQLQQGIYELNKRIDVELLLSTANQAEIINLNRFTNRSFDESNDIILEVIRAIIKDRYGSSDTVVRIHKNQQGMSISVKNDAIAACETFRTRYVSDAYFSEDAQFDSTAFLEFKHSLLLTNLNFFSHSTLQRKENRLVFYLNYSGNHNYSSDDFLVFNALFEMIHAIEFLEEAAERIEYFWSQYQEHTTRTDEIRRLQRERAEREEAERQARREEERRRYEEQQRLENERIAEQRRIEEERIAAENARQQAEYERRQQLLQNGATEGGIDIANQLLSFLGRGSAV